MVKFRYYLAFGIRVFGLILNFPSALFYSLSNAVKNDDDVFNF